jgi:LysM repeat protein
VAALVTAGSPGWSWYTIRSGDTLSEIAARYGTTASRLAQVNKLTGNGNLIYAGEKLRIPGSAASSGSSRKATRTVRHTVVRGDSLYRIAARYGASATAIARRNDLPPSLVVRLGDTLVIPRTTRTTPQRKASGGNTFAGRTYASSVVSAADRNRAVLAGRHLPSREQMRRLIVRKARANAVDPALALAVSYQESGWGMRHVSPANAVGAMQVIPATGDWISAVVGRRLDLLRPADNVTAGVVLLRILTVQTSERKAIAGYYQGLRSVRERGLYADTRRYVASVLALKARFGG